jgi:PPOX class probable F420-dependent enzyme
MHGWRKLWTTWGVRPEQQVQERWFAMSFAMNRAEREAFLAEVRVAVLALADGDGRAPLAVPIWYAYEPGGEVWFVTEPGSRKADLIGAFGRVSLCVQDERSPYRYVSVEGPVTRIGEPADRERHQRVLAYRYLGTAEGDDYLERTKELVEIVVAMRPERWRTTDFAKEPR